MRKVSTAFLTDMIFWRAEGEVVDRGDYWLIRTPSNPTFYGGNLLVFDHPPAEGEGERWLEAFEREFAGEPEVRHVLLMWDVPETGEEGAVAPFLKRGFDIQTNITLIAAEVEPPPKVNREISVKRIETEAEWQAVLDNQLRRRDERFDPEPYRAFKEKWLAARRRLVREGKGDWYGAFLDGRLVADLGLFREGDVARFQDVGTHPEFRRRGICGTLVYEASREALGAGRVKTLVMVADEGYHAARIYQRVGFKPKERYAFACLYPPPQQQG